ncbi:MAG: ABC transporter substrate-binding protein [Corynebacterium sp.]|uniref:ABC transporter substrate-binding protein n=1 Tax=Corynebacterium sp. TaxID=1720 RepID=UPI0026DC5DC7|nr:ABC transporter substrate-binding protein [Corynebacterium sp.]MDO5097911.1 ABC transporter substrate-binding protein [Corynebacterium sp.]
MKKLLRTVAAVVTAGLLASCAADPFEQSTGASSTNDSSTITIGTANFPESEIIGTIWASALEAKGYDVAIKSGIGSREVYLKALAEGSVDIVPEYSGNVTQFYLSKTSEELPTGATSADIIEKLKTVLPEEIAAGEPAPAESKDAYRVTREFAEKHKLTTLADLAALESVTVAGNPELKDRPYGAAGLKDIYNVPVKDFLAISDSGGPLTIEALQSGAADIADIYTTSPLFGADLVTLEDPKNMILPQQVLPLLRDSAVAPEVRDVINAINQKLTTERLIEMNERSAGAEKASPKKIAEDFLASV